MVEAMQNPHHFQVTLGKMPTEILGIWCQSVLTRLSEVVQRSNSADCNTWLGSGSHTTS